MEAQAAQGETGVQQAVSALAALLEQIAADEADVDALSSLGSVSASGSGSGSSVVGPSTTVWAGVTQEPSGTWRPPSLYGFGFDKVRTIDNTHVYF